MSSIVRALLRDPYFAYELRPRFGMIPNDFFYPITYYRPWQMARQAMSELNEDQSSIKLTKEGFQASVDVQQFKPNEISVKVQDHTVIIEGKHEERDDAHGTIERSFVRKYVLPQEYDMNTVQSTLSSDGVLTIKAPPPAQAIEGTKERNIEITHTNAPARESVKDKSPNDDKK
uniref:Small heat shock protein 20 n=1 Tax=Polypedilum vanderplanki TaxID=319348 RepID=E1AC55_POLVA|nr:small heat shock protein 20 [Polypedilum vanderplanki]